MKVKKGKINILKINKKTGQAIIALPLEIVHDFLDKSDLDEALERSKDDKSQDISQDELEKSLGIQS